MTVYQFTEEQLAELLRDAISQYIRKSDRIRRGEAIRYVVQNTLDDLDRDRNAVQNKHRPRDLAKQLIVD